MLHGACCMLHGAFCMLHGAFCMLHGACCVTIAACSAAPSETAAQDPAPHGRAPAVTAKRLSWCFRRFDGGVLAAEPAVLCADASLSVTEAVPERGDAGSISAAMRSCACAISATPAASPSYSSSACLRSLSMMPGFAFFARLPLPSPHSRGLTTDLSSYAWCGPCGRNEIKAVPAFGHTYMRTGRVPRYPSECASRTPRGPLEYPLSIP